MRVHTKLYFKLITILFLFLSSITIIVADYPCTDPNCNNCWAGGCGCGHSDCACGGCTGHHKSCSACGGGCNGSGIVHATCSACGSGCTGSGIIHAICSACGGECAGSGIVHATCSKCGGMCNGNGIVHKTCSECIPHVMHYSSEDSDVCSVCGYVKSRPERKQYLDQLRSVLEGLNLSQAQIDAAIAGASQTYPAENAANVDASTEKTKETSNCSAGYDPVRLPTGEFLLNIEDEIQYDYFNRAIGINRNYQSNLTASHSLGKGWSFNYDTRIILGVKYQAQEAVDAIKALLNNNFPRVYEALNNAQNVLSLARTNGYPASIVVYDIQISKYRVEFQQLENVLYAELAKAEHELMLANSNDTRDRYVFNGTDTESLKYTGNSYITFIDIQGNSHLYKINSSPKYESTLHYEDGSINYYINGTNTTPFFPGDDELYIENDGSYILTQKDKTKYFYSFYGQLECIEDSNGNQVDFVYDNHVLSYIQDDFGRKTQIFHNDAGLISRVIDPKNRVFNYEYTQDRLSSFTDAEGIEKKYSYTGNLLTEILHADGSSRKYIYADVDGRQRIIQNVDEEGNNEYFSYNLSEKYTQYSNDYGGSERYYYDDQFLTTKIEHADGSTIQMEYDEQHNMVKKIDELGKVWQYAYDDRRNITQSIDPNGYAESWTWNNWNRIASYADKLGNLTYYDYDSKGNLITVRYPDGTSVSMTYDDCGQIISQSDQAGNAMSITYDNYGYFSTITDKEGNTSVLDMDILGQTQSITDALDGKTSYEYDLNDNVISVTDALGNTELYEYNARKDLVKVTDKNGNMTLLEYDKSHHLLRVIDATGGLTEYQYRPDGKIMQESINGISTTQYKYDNRGQVIARKNKETGIQENFSYDAAGHMIVSIDPNSNRTEYFYDALGQVTQSYNAEGYHSFVEYDAKGRVSAAVDSKGNRTEYNYDVMNRLISVTDALDQTESYSYEARGLLVEYTDKKGNAFALSYNKNGQKIKETDALGQSVNYAYNSLGRVVSITDKNGSVTQFTYDALGQTLSQINALGIVNTYSYDAIGNLISQTDLNNNTWTYQYDAVNRLKTKTDPYGNATLYQYNLLDQVYNVTNALNEVSQYQYDALGRIIKETNPIGENQSYQYDSNGNLLSQIDPMGRITEYAYDGLNRLLSTTNPMGNISTQQYDPNGNVIQITDPANHSTTYEFDALNRLITETNATGISQSFEYDANNGLLKKVDFNGQSTFNIYDALGRLIRSDFSDGSYKQFSYDADNNIAQASTAESQLSYQYDALNRMTSSYDGVLDQTIYYSYDNNGNRIGTSWLDDLRQTQSTYGKCNELLTLTDADGNKTRYVYDALLRETKRTLPNNVKTDTVYDPAGRITSIINYTTSRHNNKNILKAYAWIYNAAGQKTYQIDQDGHLTTYSYDDAGRLTQAQYAFGQGKERIDFEERLDMGLYPEYIKGKNPKSKLHLPYPYSQFSYPGNFPGYLTASLENRKDVYCGWKNDKDWPKAWKFTPAEGATNFMSQLSIDTSTSESLNDAYSIVSDNNGHGHDQLDTAQWMWTEAFTYDDANNRTQKANGWGKIDYAYDVNNRLLSSGNRTYSYDDNGNLISEALGIVKADYKYNAENRIVEVIDPVPGFKPGKYKKDSGVKYSYDAFGRRINRTDYEVKNSSGYKTWNKESGVQNLFDGLGFNVMAEFDVDMHPGKSWENDQQTVYTASRENTYANGFILSQVTFYGYDHDNKCISKTKDTQWFSQDTLGSTVLVTDRYGHVDEAFAYDTFGTSYQGHLGTFDLGYNGKIFDEKTGFYNYGFRDYSPQLGRFTTVDPIKADTNWYVLSNNDPINFKDMYGLFPIYAQTLGIYIEINPGYGYTLPEGFVVPGIPQSSTPIGPVPGYSESGTNSWRADNDNAFTKAVNDYNTKYDLYPGDDAYVTPQMLKAQAMVESGGHKEEFLRDPLQVNNPGDWVDKKTTVTGLTKNQEMTPALSAEAALEWRRYKGYIHDSTGAETDWRGDWEAYRRYNGNTNPSHDDPTLQHRDWYANKVMELYGEMTCSID